MMLLWLLPVAALASCALSSGGDYEQCRRNLIAAVFGTPTLPSRDPDVVSPGPNPLDNNQTEYVWLISDPSCNCSSPTLKAHVFLSLNSSCHQQPTYDTGPIAKGGEYRWPYWPSHRTRTLLLYHNGHETDTAVTDYDGVAAHFNALGFDVAEFDLPLYGFNALGGGRPSHEWFEPYEKAGVRCLRYFVEPVVLMTDYALRRLGYERVVMLGLSGGGWTTTLAAAVDTRITLSFPVAGSLPFDMYDPRYDSRDWEQLPERPVFNVTSMRDLYVLGGSGGEGRGQLQLLHMMDSCCWTACTRQQAIAAYNAQVQSAGANFRTAVTAGNVHEVNVRDKVIVAMFAQLLAQGKTASFVDAAIPFDLM